MQTDIGGDVKHTPPDKPQSRNSKPFSRALQALSSIVSTSSKSQNMTPKQYKTIIEQLGLSQERAGEWLGVSARTGQNYAAKGPPEPVAKLLRLMVRLKLKPEDVS